MAVVLRDLDKLIATETKIPVVKIDDPLTAVVRGTGIVLEDLEHLREILIENDAGTPLR